MKHKKIAFLSLPIIALLSGCGGGGGGGSSLSQTTFSDWSSITKPTQVNLEGISVDYDYTASSTAVTSVTNNGTDQTATASVAYRTDGTISKVVFSTDNVSQTFDENGTDTIGDSGTTIYGYDQAGQDFFLAADALNSSNSWNYQTFGIWETGRGTGSGTAGGITVGAATSGANIPTSGSATYSGIFGGVAVDIAGEDVITRGNVTLATDFANRSINFSTSSSQYFAPARSNPSWTSKSSLNMSGTLTYSSATNLFTGSVSDTFINGSSGNLGSGSVTGKFYGTNAEEAGGVFNLLRSGTVMAHGGAFGAKR